MVLVSSLKKLRLMFACASGTPRAVAVDWGPTKILPVALKCPFSAPFSVITFPARCTPSKDGSVLNLSYIFFFLNNFSWPRSQFSPGSFSGMELGHNVSAFSLSGVFIHRLDLSLQMLVLSEVCVIFFR